MKKLLLAVIILLTINYSLLTPAALAQTPTANPKISPSFKTFPKGISITLSPTFITLETDPGKKTSSQFKVTNNNTFSEDYVIVIAKFAADSEGSSPVIMDAQTTDDFVEWVKFSEDKFKLNPNQSKTINFSISPPKSANLGYYYAFLVRRAQDAQAESGTSVSGAAALPVLLEVKSPNAKREIQIVDFSTDKMFYEYLPTKFEIKVKNSGNVHAVPFGDIFIDSMLNREIAIIQANEGRGNVLPQSLRTYTSIWDDAFATVVEQETEGGKKVQKTNYDFSKANKFRIGKYTANLILVYDNGTRDIPIEARVSFWVIPWKIILGVTAAVIGPALLVYLIMRWRFSKMLKNR